MCGIAGAFGPRELPDWRQLASALSTALAHRGPDGEGFLIAHGGSEPSLCRRVDDFGRVGSPATGLLVHRRLSIVDLVTGDQPMRSSAAPVWVVFNGEIYNHLEIRDELARAHGVRFRTRSDTEVVLEAYRVWGTRSFSRLNGIFAIAILDLAARELVLARDPLGVKPLYWGRFQHHVWFASELKAALATSLLTRDVNPVAVAQFLHLRFTPAPATLWRGASKVSPGHVLRFNESGVLLEASDFTPAPEQASIRRTSDAVDALAAALPIAVRRQQMADVPVGVLLSGGLDSSLLMPGMVAATAEAVPSFAVGFPELPGYPSELAVARRAARLFGTRHHERELDPGSYFARLGDAIWQADEPLAHPGMIMQLELSALAHQHVKVVMTGQGADEPLGGYPRHQSLRLTHVFGRLAAIADRPQFGTISRRIEAFARFRQMAGASSEFSRACSVFSAIGAEAATNWLRVGGVDSDMLTAPLRHWWDKAADLDDLARALYLEARTALAEDLLLVSDRMAMRYSLEARVPYLDLEYLRLLESLPGPLRVHLLDQRKHLQHRLGARMLPPELARALKGSGLPWRRKLGFSVPIAPWLRTRFSGQLVEFVAGPDALLPEYFEQNRLRCTAEDFLGGRGRSYRLVLSLVVLEWWLRMHVRDEAPGLSGRLFAEAPHMGVRGAA